MTTVRIAASLGFGMALSAMVASAGLSRQALATDNAEIPAALWGAQGEALELGAEIAQERGEPTRAEALARGALRHSPGHVTALRVLAQAAQAHGDTDAAARFMALAGRWSWRDTPTQGWLFDQAVGRRDFRRAMDHADAILRMHEIEHELFGVLRYAGEDPEFRRALTKRLAERPDWRAGFFMDAVQAKDDQRPGLEAIIRELRNTAAPIIPVELRGYAALLVKSGEIPRAAALWTSQFGGDPDTGLTLDWPSEVRAGQKLPFDWWITSTRGVSAAAGSADNAPLSLAADRGALGFVAARLFALPPGRYRIAFAGTQPPAPVRRALHWTVQCPGGVTSEASVEGDGWSVAVPQSCPVQTLRLGVDNDDVRFKALLGGVRLQRVGRETSAITG